LITVFLHFVVQRCFTVNRSHVVTFQQLVPSSKEPFQNVDNHIVTDCTKSETVLWSAVIFVVYYHFVVAK